MGVIHKIGRRTATLLEQQYHCKQKKRTTTVQRTTVDAVLTLGKRLWWWFNWSSRAVRMALARVMCEVNAENRAILKPKVC
jgi:hypothetical protein